VAGAAPLAGSALLAASCSTFGTDSDSGATVEAGAGLPGDASPAADAKAEPPGDAGVGDASTVDGLAPDKGAAYRAVVLADNPSGYWRLGDPSGSTTAKDSSVRAHDGNASTTGCAFGRPGALTGDTAVALDGQGSIGVRASFPVNGRVAFSVEAWVALAKPPLSDSYLVANEVPGIAGYGLLVSRTGFKLERLSGGTATSANGGTPVASSDFVYIVGTYDGVVLRLYLNGEFAGSAPDGNTINTAPSALFIGSQGETTGRFAGALDEIAVYDFALTPPQILAHYNAAMSP
jgi:hypothetical protein